MHKLSELLADLDLPHQAPVAAPAAALPRDPGVWSMPCRGIEWCDCGKHHPISRQLIEKRGAAIVRDPLWMTHQEVIAVALDFWRHPRPCAFFVLGVDQAANVVCGTPAGRYGFARGVEIIGYFSKTWQGCPEASCPCGSPEPLG